MIRWKAQLSNGELATEGVVPWVELPGERLPWPRLCAYLEENELHIEGLGLLDDQDNPIVFPSDSVCWLSQDKDPEYYGVQYDINVDNLFGDSTIENLVHVSFHFNDYVDHIWVSSEDGRIESSRTDVWTAMCPSPRRKIDG